MKINNKKLSLYILLSLCIILALTSCSSGSKFEYEIYDSEHQPIPGATGANRYVKRVITKEHLNKNEIEELLKYLKENEIGKIDEDKDQVYIYLYDNEVFADSMFSLGMLSQTEGNTKIISLEKNWDNKPEESEYEIFKLVDDKILEFEEINTERFNEALAKKGADINNLKYDNIDSLSGAIKIVSQEKGLSEDQVDEIYEKVTLWSISG
ncbi:MAG TPA: hypothetical protein VIG40_08695 [Tissierellaceae bacterium]